MIDALDLAVRDAVASPTVQHKLGRLGVRVQACTPAALQALPPGGIQRWGGMIRATKIAPE